MKNWMKISLLKFAKFLRKLLTKILKISKK
jgi:hypothetical protein